MQSLQPKVRVTLDTMTWLNGPPAILLWEAFVSGPAHTKTKNHAQDAATAAVQFLDDFEHHAQSAVTVNTPRRVFSLAGAALLWAGLSTELALLRTPTMVVKPETAWQGQIDLV